MVTWTFRVMNLRKKVSCGHFGWWKGNSQARGRPLGRATRSAWSVAVGGYIYRLRWLPTKRRSQSLHLYCWVCHFMPLLTTFLARQKKHLLWHINDVLHKCEKISRLHGFHYLGSPPCHFLLVRTALRRAYTPARRSKQTAQAKRKGLLRLLRADDPLSSSSLYVLMVLFLRAGQPARTSSECFALEVH